MQVSDSLIELVGGTPLVRLGRMAAHLRPQVLAKVEYLNPGGSGATAVGQTTTSAP